MNAKEVEEEEEKPLFVPEINFQKPVTYHSNSIQSRLKHSTYANDGFVQFESDLLWTLQMEAMFQLRTPKLALLLKARARQFLAKHDLSDISGKYIYNMTCRTIGAAMCVTQAEEDVRVLLGSKDQTKLRAAHTKFIRDGVLRSGGMFRNTWNEFQFWPHSESTLPVA